MSAGVRRRALGDPGAGGALGPAEADDDDGEDREDESGSDQRGSEGRPDVRELDDRSDDGSGDHDENLPIPIDADRVVT